METDGAQGVTNGGRPGTFPHPNGGQPMMNAKHKTLKLVTEHLGEREETNHCEACDARRQLEHVRMCLHAAMLAAGPKPSKPKYKKPS